MEQGNDGTLELSSTTSVDGGGAEGLPDDVLANVGGYEERDTRSQSISPIIEVNKLLLEVKVWYILLQELIQNQNNDSREEQLKNNEEGISSTKICNITVHAGHNVSGTLSDSDEHTQH